MPLTDEQKESLEEARASVEYLGLIEYSPEEIMDCEIEPVAHLRALRSLLSIIDALQADAGSSLRWVLVSEGLPELGPEKHGYRESALLLFKVRDRPKPLLGTLLRSDTDPYRMLAFVSPPRSEEWKPADVTHYCIITGPEVPTE